MAAKENHGGNVTDSEALNDMPYLEAAIHESLRISSNLTKVDRRCRQDVTLSNGIKLPKGMTIWIPIHAVMKSPKFYPEPELFKPERFLKTPDNPSPTTDATYLAFGGGPR